MIDLAEAVSIPHRRVNFLQADDRCIQVLEDGCDPARVRPSISANALVDIIRDYGEVSF